MISKQTIFALLLTLLLAGGMYAWRVEHFDACDRFGAEKSGTPMAVMVQSGTRTITVPCTIWVMRQPLWMQGLCALLTVLGVIFVLSVWSDWSRAADRRRRGLG